MSTPAQNDPAVSASLPIAGQDTVDQDQLDAARKAAESDTTLTDEVRKKVLGLYEQAADWLQQTATAETELARLNTQVKDAPERIEALRAQLKVPPLDEVPVETLEKDASLNQLELVLSQDTLALTQDRGDLSKQQEELTRLLVGTKGLSEDIAVRTAAIDQIEKDLLDLRPNGSAVVSQAHGLVLKVRRQLRQTELELLKLRLGSLNLLTSLAQAERDVLEARIARRETRVDALKQVVQRLREKQVREAWEEAEEINALAVELPQEIQTIAQENARYRKELETLVPKEKSVAAAFEQVRVGLDGIKTDFERTRQRVDVVGPSAAIGKMLMRRRDALPSAQSYRRASAERREAISLATDRQIEIDELTREYADVQRTVTEVLASLAPEIPEAEKSELESQVSDLVRARRDALGELQTVYGRYIGELTTLDLAERQLVDVSGAFVDYIDDQLLWVPGADILDLAKPSQLENVFEWLFSTGRWLGVSDDLWQLVRERPGSVFVLLWLFALLLAKHAKAVSGFPEIARDTRMIRTDAFRLTLKTLGLTLVAVGAWPLLMIGSGWLLGRLPTADSLTLALANGLWKAGLTQFGLRIIWRMCLPDGLGDRHLRWPGPVRESLVKEFGWLIPVVVPLSFLTAACASNALPSAVQLVGHLTFILLMGASAVFVYRVLRAQGVLMSTARGDTDGGIWAQLHFLWFPALFLLPVALALASALGYHYTALHLQRQAELTFWFFLGLFLLKELLLRSLYIIERRLRYEDALCRHEELRAQRGREAHGKEDKAPLISPDIPELDFDELGDQAKRLVRAGFLFISVIGTWLIWSELLPALGFLNTTELPFQADRIVDGIAKEVPVTLGDLIIGLIIVLVTVLAAKNLPGVLEITLLQRLPLDPGARYAITALSQYAIAGIGIFATFSTIGLQWSSIQWLVAALSVGLGFGLQEIVANFVSGIILLFERPIRVGDVVTVNNTTGVVSRIRIRATTITNYDKQELLIPNKQFITSDVINWTLTDKMNRILITVGVAYGSDVYKAMELLLEAADENQEILKDPKPVASFEGFGDNALTLLLRSYLGSMENRLANITALHQAINDKFAAAGINIAFPQRDIHLDAERPLDIRLHRASRSDIPAARG